MEFIQIYETVEMIIFTASQISCHQLLFQKPNLCTPALLDGFSSLRHGITAQNGYFSSWLHVIHVCYGKYIVKVVMMKIPANMTGFYTISASWNELYWRFQL
jgi:hypothetical protein